MTETYSSVRQHGDAPDILVIELRQPPDWSQREQQRVMDHLLPIVKSQYLATAQPPLLILDCTGLAEAPLAIFARLQYYISRKGGRICLLDRNQAITEVGHDPATMEQAVQTLMPFRQPLVRDEDGLTDSKTRLMTEMTVSLVGCPKTDLGALPSRFATAGLAVREAGHVCDSDHVIFCISCPNGVSDGTRLAVSSCSARTITPLAIVLTDYSLLDNDSLRELITLEERELLSQIVPMECVDRLSLLYDFDPGLLKRLLAAVPSAMQVTCKTWEHT